MEGRFGLGRKFSGMKAGVLGMGRIGGEVARRLQGFKCEIGYFDPVPRDVPYKAYPDARHRSHANPTSCSSAPPASPRAPTRRSSTAP